MGKIKLFCLPYAGGTANAYKRWDNCLHNSIELCPIELAGRGTRYGEDTYNSLEKAVDDVYKIILDELNQMSYVLYGHSMGCILAYELYYKIKKVGGQEPVHIFFSGRQPPHIKGNDKIIHDLPKEEFKQEIMDLGGTPKELFENKELLDIFLPILRADYKIVEEYNYTKRDNKINCDITVFGGSEEDFTNENIKEWRMHTNGKSNFYIFEGGHFFIHKKENKIIKIINEILKKEI